MWAPLAPESFTRRTGELILLSATELETLASAQPKPSPLVIFVDPAFLSASWASDERSECGSDRRRRSSEPSTPIPPAKDENLSSSFRIVITRSESAAEQRKPVKLRAGAHVFVKLPWETHLRVSTATGAFGFMSGHSALAAGAPVVAAGELEVDEHSRLVRWSNKSGTYRIPPTAAAAAQLPLDAFYKYNPGEFSGAYDFPRKSTANEGARNSSARNSSARNSGTRDSGTRDSGARNSGTYRAPQLRASNDEAAAASAEAAGPAAGGDGRPETQRLAAVDMHTSAALPSPRLPSALPNRCAAVGTHGGADHADGAVARPRAAARGSVPRSLLAWLRGAVSKRAGT